MNFIKDFKMEIKKDNILKLLKCSNHSSAYHQISNVCDLILKDIEKLIYPIACYKFGEKNKQIDLIELKNCSSVVYCFITLGNEISKEIEKYFNNDQYMEGIILDAASDYILFEISNQLYNIVCEDAKKRGVGLTQKFSPGSEGFPIENQKYIIEELSGYENLKVEITEGFMLKPIKSLSFIMGADKCLNIIENKDECSRCTSNNCPLRKESYRENDKVNLTVIAEGKRINIKANKSDKIIKILNENNIFINSPCSGNGTCGKCKVKVLEGRVKKLENNNILGNELLMNGWCLACSTYLESDSIISLENRSNNFNILDKFEKSRIEINPKYKTEKIEIDINSLNGGSLTEYINNKFNKEFIYSIRALRKLSKILNYKYKNQDEDLYEVILNDNKVLDICRFKESRAYGIAIDIGTTTIVISLVDLFTGKILNSHSTLNSQRHFGADVISRIHYLIEKGINSLNQCIKKDIREAIEYIINKEEINAENIYEIAIAGNTTMICLLLGLECECLSFAPFNTVTTSILKFNYKDIFDDFIDCNVTILPGVSAYVGADILSGISYCGFDKIDKVSMLIDIGTNGEMVIGNKDKILCLATAAGPAFEGANISCGTGSISGAISEIYIYGDKVEYKTIGDLTPVGICGSAVIDITSECLKNSIIDNTGRFDETKYKNLFIVVAKDELKRDIVFNQKDVREVQLAKSAIYSGIEILIKEFNCSYEDIDTVFIAGGFGSYLNIENAVRIGLIPEELKKRIKIIGNSSLGGAIKYLINKDSDREIFNIINRTKYIDISSNMFFNDLFIENMMF